jgi:hypothetical protein
MPFDAQKAEPFDSGPPHQGVARDPHLRRGGHSDRSSVGGSPLIFAQGSSHRHAGHPELPNDGAGRRHPTQVGLSTRRRRGKRARKVPIIEEARDLVAEARMTASPWVSSNSGQRS